MLMVWLHPHRNAFQQFSPVFHANTFVDISSTLETKIAAMQVYESEACVFPHPRSPDALQSIAHRWGSVAGVIAAEAFMSPLQKGRPGRRTKKPNCFVPQLA